MRPVIVCLATMQAAVTLAGCIVDGSLGSNVSARPDAATEEAPDPNPELDSAGAGGAPEAASHGGSAGSPLATGHGGETTEGLSSDAGRGLPAPDAAPLLCLAQPDDDACLACQREQCCTEFAECSLHVPCQCFVECLAPGVSAEECQTHCEIASVPELEAASECASSRCANECL